MFTPREASLITEEEAADGRISLRATNEAINVVVARSTSTSNRDRQRRRRGCRT
jgi:hypothetical protein